MICLSMARIIANGSSDEPSLLSKTDTFSKNFQIHVFRDRRYSNSEQDAMTQPLDSLMTASALPPALGANAETDLYRRRLQRLPRRVQQVFLLSRLDDLSYTDIALLLDVDASTVERCMTAALEHCVSEPAEHDPARAILLQALRWYVHLQSPQATASQRIEFRHWLDADPRHLAAFQNSEQFWRRLHAPASILGASGWHRRKPHIYFGWLLVTMLLCGLLVTAEAYS